MKKLVILYSTIILATCLSLKENALKLADYMEESVIVEKPILDSTEKKAAIPRDNPSLVQLSFFGAFDDSLEIYQDGKHLSSLSIYSKNNPFSSTDFSGIEVNLISKAQTCEMLIKLLSNKKFIKFQVETKYPIYMVQRYGAEWNIRPLLQYPNLK